MAQEKAKTVVSRWKEMLGEDGEFLRRVVQEVVQQVLEAEMEEALQAGKGEVPQAPQENRQPGASLASTDLQNLTDTTFGGAGRRGAAKARSGLVGGGIEMGGWMGNGFGRGRFSRRRDRP